MNKNPLKIAVLVSGSGSNLQAIMDSGLSSQIVGVLSNKADAYALERAKKANINTAVISHKDFPTREQFDAEMHKQLLEWEADLVVLAGFMRILSADFVKNWQGKMLNIHPSLLPVYKGMHTHQRVLNTGDKFHGCTVHFVTAELDAGQAIAQAKLTVSEHDNADTLQQRVHKLEHFIYPLVVNWFNQGMIKWENGQVFFNNQPLEKPFIFSPTE